MSSGRSSPRGRDRLALGEYESDGELRVGVADLHVTDAERRAAGVETLAAAERRLRRSNRRRARACWETRASPLPDGAQLRRVWRPRPLAELRERLGNAGAAIWSEGDVLEFLYRGAAERVHCSSGVQLEMWRAGRSDVWELSVRVARLDEAVISLVAIPLGDGDNAFGGPLGEPVHFRGPAAPAAPDQIDTLPATRSTGLEAPGIGGPRGVSAWRPEAPAGDLPVVYCADNAAMSLARTVGAAVAAGRLPPVLLVGIESGHATAGVDRRAQEYLPGVSRRRFAHHERFVLEHVLPWAEREHGATADPRRRFALGFSNGATWALAMAQRHPGTFAGVAAFSVAGLPPRRALHNPGQRYALCAGILEPGFAANTAAWVRALRRGHETHVSHREPVAGHDFVLWLEQAPWALGELLGP